MRRMGIGRGMLSSLLLSSALLLVAMPTRCSGWTASATTNVELVKNLQRDGYVEAAAPSRIAALVYPVNSLPAPPWSSHSAGEFLSLFPSLKG